MNACTTETGWLRWIECHPGTAAWVQAIFTIVALLIAIGIPVFHDFLIRRRRGHQISERVREIARLAGAAIGSTLEEPTVAMIENAVFRRAPIWDALGDRIKDVPIINVTDNGIQTLIITLQMILLDVGALSKNPSDMADMIRSLGAMKSDIDEIYERLGKSQHNAALPNL